MRRLRNQPLPQWFLDEPDLIPGVEWYFKAFWDLSTERQIGYTLGPIPASKVSEYGREHGLRDDTLVLFRDMMKELDRAYLKWVKDEQDKKRRSLKNQTNVKS